MSDFLEIARALELVREDRKWYANVEAVRCALVEADRAAYVRGVNDGLTGKRERAVGIVDEYAPPVGPVAVCNEETAQASVAHFVARLPHGAIELSERASYPPSGSGLGALYDHPSRAEVNAGREFWEAWVKLNPMTHIRDYYAGQSEASYCDGGCIENCRCKPSVPQPDGDCRFPEEAE